MSQILQETFREELQELLEDLEHGLLLLEKSPGDAEAVNRVFRTLHTIKGSGSLAGFDRLAGFAHHLEAVFEEVRAGQVNVDSALIDLTLRAQDMIQTMAMNEESLNQAETDALVAELERYRGSFSSEEVSPESGDRPGKGGDGAGKGCFWIRFVPPADIFARGLDPANLVRELGRQGDARIFAHCEKLTCFDDYDPMKIQVFWDIILVTEQTVENLMDIFIFVEDESDLRFERLEGDGDINLDDVWDECCALFRSGEPVTPESLNGLLCGSDIHPAIPEYEGPERRITDDDRRKNDDRRTSGKGGGGKAELASSVRVRSERLDKLVDLIGELVTVQARLKQISSTIDDVDLGLVSEEVEQLTWELRDEVLSIRMVPIGTTFNRFARQVRDLARDLGKEVQLLTEGGETELDKTVIERLSDPILHLLRNAIDHGIESPDRRRENGKPEQGTIHLSAGQSGASVIIEIYDDGSGLNLDWIQERGLAAGLLQPEDDIEQVNLWDIISSAGFSTSRTITNVSGRGVGLDVVRKSIEELRGTVELQTVAGEGTCFRLKLPLTLAIIDGLLVKVGRERFVMPLSQIEEIIEQTQADIERQHGRDLLHIRDEIVPYLHLRQQFQINGEAPEIEQVIIANLEGGRIGFAVDYVIGEHQTVIKSLGSMYSNIPGLSGATILGDGSLALILDLPALMRAEEAKAREFEEGTSSSVH